MGARTASALARLVTRAEQDPDVLAVLLFGSHARGEASPESDIDVCLVLAGEPGSDLERAQKRLDYLAETDLDVAVFQSLPLHIRSRVLKEGRVLFARDEEALYAVAFRTARAWDGFRHIHRQYLDEVSRG
ncbi:MAG TPA: nucleotidyltransferase domain-containing protein [Candidatus Rokubacteria bacterium]|nr:nucleotidyltransferase domain-containing protein [Candidatus Rokubacteria bacterium]